MSKKTYTITDLAREFDVTTRTIRFYEEKRFLQPRREGRNRIYSRRDRTHLRLLLRGRRLGWALDDIWDIINLYNSQGGEEAQLKAMLTRLDETRAQLDAQLEDIRSARIEIDQIEANCRERYRIAREGAQQDTPNPED